MSHLAATVDPAAVKPFATLAVMGVVAGVIKLRSTRR